MDKITKLTKDQEQLSKDYTLRARDELESNARADRDAVAEAVAALYALHKLPPPHIAWFQSPFDLLDTYIDVATNTTVSPKKRELLGPAPSVENLAETIRDEAWQLASSYLGVDAIAGPLYFKVFEEMRSGLMTRYVRPFLETLNNALRVEYLDKDRDGRRAAAEAVLPLMVSGNMEMVWLRFYDFWYEVMGIRDGLEQTHALSRVARQVGHFVPTDRTFYVSEKATVAAYEVTTGRNSRVRMHNATGPAIGYADGRNLYRYRGIEVPKKVIEAPETITLSEIAYQRNSELRRIFTLQYGIERWVRDNHMKPLDQDRDLHGMRTLYGFRDELGDVRYVKLENSTPERDGSIKPYFFRVPPNIQSCKAAVAWMYNMTPEKYAPVAES